MMKQKPLVRWLSLAIGLASPALLLAQSDGSDTQRVGNMQYGNSLDPTGWAPYNAPDPAGMSYLHPDQLRTPTGALYPTPSQSPNPSTPFGGNSDWLYSGYLELGYLYVGGDRRDEFLQMYSDWRKGVAGTLAFFAYNPKTGQYAELRGSRISDHDQYYRLRAGQYGRYKIEAFYRDIPHTLSTTAYPFWNGVGSSNLTLPAGLQPGSSQAAATAVEANRPRQTLQVNRQSEGVSWEGALTRNWIGYGGVTTEHRTGDRDWGGPMFFSYFGDSAGPGGPGTPTTPSMLGGDYQTVRPVDFTTTDVNIGLRNKGGALGWLFNFTGTASFFRDHASSLSYAAPFSVLPGYVGSPTGGTWSLEPDNNYYNVRLEASHPLKFWNGQFSASVAYGSMRQNAQLQSPLNPMYCPTGQYIPTPPNTTPSIACANWNTMASLSQQDGDARIDTGLINLRVDFRPTTKLSWYANLRWYDEDNMTRYSLYNPLTGQYGYVPENGSETLVTGETDLFKSGSPYQNNFAQIASIPYSYNDRKAELGGSYRLSPDNTLGVSYLLDRQTPRPRERTYINDQHLKFTWDTKSFGDSTLRLSYEYEKRTGSPYNSNPYLNYYSPSQPGFNSDIGYIEWTVAQMYKYDMSNLKASKLKAILTTPLGDTATITTTLYGNRNQYGADIGRQSFGTTGADVSWDWAPTVTTTLSAYASIESTRLKQGNVNDNEALIGTNQQMEDQLGSPFFPYANQWTATDNERDANIGARFSHTFSPRVRVDLDYDYTYSRGLNSYDYASLCAVTNGYSGYAEKPLPPKGAGPCALATTPLINADEIGSSFPQNVYRMQKLTANLNFALTARLGLRLYGEYEYGNYADWNYAGFNTPADLVIGNRIFTDLGPQPHWHATVVGAFINLKL